jgi:predicted Zn-dependent protease
VASKKRRPGKPAKSKARSVSPRLAEALSEIDQLMRRGRAIEAEQRLVQLERQYPHHPDVLGFHINVAAQLGDFAVHQSLCQQLLLLQPDRSDVHLVLAGAYLRGDRPALAMRAFREFLARFPTHPEVEKVRRTLAEVEPRFQQHLSAIGLTGDDAQALAELHELVQVHLHRGEWAETRRLAEELLARRPNFLPALNNMAEAWAREGRLDRAEATARRVLEIAPDNVHALGNLARTLLFQGCTAAAAEIGNRLRVLRPLNGDLWAKIAETFTYLGDDEGVMAAVDAARLGTVPDPGTAGFLEHLAGVASYRLGREQDARRHWQQALKHQAGLAEARKNLEDLRKPIGERNAAWPFPYLNWLSAAFSKELSELLEATARRTKDSIATQRLKDFATTHEVGVVVPLLLDRGDPGGRQLAMHLAAVGRTPALLQALRDFAMSHRGPDALRVQAAQIATEAGLIPSGPMRMFTQGQWREVIQLSFEVSDRPDHKHSAEVEKLANDAHELLGLKDAGGAERLLRKALEKEPDAPDLLNNLAAARALQGHEEECHRMIRDLHARFPDYLFARVTMARIAIDAGQLDEAQELMKPVLRQRKFHSTEFTALAQAQIHLLLARGEREGARQWLEMWEKSVPGHPDQSAMRRHIRDYSVWDRLRRRRP